MKTMKVIEPAQTEQALPIVFVPKKNGTLPFCVDFCKCNAVTTRDSYALQRMDECIDTLRDAKIFSTLGANSSYWQIEVHKSDLEKTKFTSHHGLYKLTRMPFGLCNAPATIQRVMNIVLSAVK